MTDLGSTNGTYLDEEELPPNRAADLYVGSRVVFGERASLHASLMLCCVSCAVCASSKSCWSQIQTGRSSGDCGLSLNQVAIVSQVCSKQTPLCTSHKRRWLLGKEQRSVGCSQLPNAPHHHCTYPAPYM